MTKGNVRAFGIGFGLIDDGESLIDFILRRTKDNTLRCSMTSAFVVKIARSGMESCFGGEVIGLFLVQMSLDGSEFLIFGLLISLLKNKFRFLGSKSVLCCGEFCGGCSDFLVEFVASACVKIFLSLKGVDRGDERSKD